MREKGYVDKRMEKKRIIVTTTPKIEGRRIIEYKGVVFGEVASSVDFVRDFVTVITKFLGGKSGSYEEELIKAREQAMYEMQSRTAVVRE